MVLVGARGKLAVNLVGKSYKRATEEMRQASRASLANWKSMCICETYPRELKVKAPENLRTGWALNVPLNSHKDQSE